ncbi:MAG: choice-of-anchor J domain-containing protein [Prevotellaceae bacterium]|jgi:PKD repeat protein|nr:choice-of-anchor J domain-containing protein [Prevotellaceae bacterium]
MKKSLLFLAILFLTVSVTGQKKNAPHSLPTTSDSAKSPANEMVWANVDGNFIATDINGNEHNLQAYLDAGKAVIVDYSAVWCHPCWQFHESGTLEQLHNNYGPGGTDELVVLWIEIDHNTTLDDIEGKTDRSIGDWTDGGTWPVPIINDGFGRPCLTPLAELYDESFPTIFMVFPNGAYRNITSEIRESDGADLIYSLLGSCPDETDPPVIYTLNEITQNCVGGKNEFKVAYFSVGNTTATWTFQDGTPPVATGKSAIATWDQAGTYEVNFKLTNPAGTVERTQTIEIIDLPVDVDDKTVNFETAMLGSNFAADFSPYNWITIDNDNGSIYPEYAPYGLSGKSAFVIADISIIGRDDQLLISMIEPYEGNKCAMSMANFDKNNDDWLISPKIQLGDESSISLYVRSGLEYAGEEEYQIAVSTTDQAPASFTVIGGKRTAPFEWTQVKVDLSAYDNQEVHLAINNIGNDHFTFLVDNIEIKTKNVSSVNRLLSDQFDIYPNPAKNTVHINCPDLSDIQLFNIQGKEVMNIAADSDNETINVSDLPEGHYLLMVRTKENKFGTQKITVIKEQH